jgi:8-oxo-dGTP diphosphatase
VTERVVVVAAVVETDGSFLVTRRLDGTHLAGYWEFPGGKVQPGESLEAALQREIAEELDTDVVAAREIYRTAHDYQERSVELHFFRADLARAPRPVLGQELRWVQRGEFATLQFPPADSELVDNLLHARL